jgi:ABC-2 type transport system permease protein
VIPLAPAVPATRLERARWGLHDAWAITRRDLLHWVAEPIRIVTALLWSVMLVLLFGVVLGSGMQVPGGGDYMEFLIPGLLVQAMAFGVGETMTAVTTDAANGVTDRFRAMPMARSAVVVGRSLADMINSVFGLAVLVGVGLAVGWEWHGTTLEALAAIGLLLLLRFAFLWLGILLGLLARSPEAVQGLWAALFPVTMLSSAFVAPALLPDWLALIADWNPLSSTVGATRDLFGNPGAPDGGTWIESHAVLMAIAWPLAMIAVLLPLSVRRYARLSR